MIKTILLLPKFVLTASSKMSHESEHSQSEFYYPGELSHAELLHQPPTDSESKERNLTVHYRAVHPDNSLREFKRSAIKIAQQIA